MQNTTTHTFQAGDLETGDIVVGNETTDLYIRKVTRNQAGEVTLDFTIRQTGAIGRVTVPATQELEVLIRRVTIL